MAESDFHEWLVARSRETDRLQIPIGDDLAALRWSDRQDGLLIVGADQVLEGVHFDLKTTSAKLAGRKAMLRNLSDCAAMACLPVGAIVTFALPRGSGEGTAQEIIEGIEEAGRPFACPLVGGDTGSWDGPLAISVTILGRSAGVEPIRRSGAKPGDKLYVTGALGGSIRGRHLSFEPRIHLARELARWYHLYAMIDLSDGLSRDLPRLCAASGVGATVDAARIPIHDDAQAMNDGISPLDHALHDGEDYELLFTSAHCDHAQVIEIGTIDDEMGVRIRSESGNRETLVARGWEHSL